MSRISIKFHNIYLPHILTRKILTKNFQNQYSELCISEYDITEAIDLEEIPFLQNKHTSPFPTIYMKFSNVISILKNVFILLLSIKTKKQTTMKL